MRFFTIPAVMLTVCLLTGAATPPTITIRGGGYSGTCTNQTYGISARLRLVVDEFDGVLSGDLDITGELVGGGPIRGTIEGDCLNFATYGWFGLISWSGRIRGKTISGCYRVDSPDGSTQHGVWSVSRK
jgi:hypothetical protein